MEKIKKYIKKENAAFWSNISKAEYLLWWVIRILQIGALIRLIKSDPEDVNVMLLTVNLAATFLFPLIRVLFGCIKLTKKISYRAQTWLTIMIFFGSFLGQGCRWNHEVTSWDKVLHLLAGGFIVLVGNEFINVFVRKGDRISPLFRTFTAVGFSYMAITLWEVFEFFADYYWAESCNQAYNISPERDPWFFKIFGMGVQNENQWAVFDTNVDMMCAVVGAIPVAIALLIYLTKKEKKANMSADEADDVTDEEVTV